MPVMLEAIRKAKRPVALTGAGISAPSGVPTFQSTWKGLPMRSFLDIAYYRRDPIGAFELFCSMEQWSAALPNEAHLALARLGIPVITQNIDGLHQAAGSGQVIELHGNLRSVVCRGCGRRRDAHALCSALRPCYQAEDQERIMQLLTCDCGKLWAMDIVLYGEAVREMDLAESLVRSCDLLLVIGTSLETYPAALLPRFAREHGAKVLVEDQDCISALVE